VEGLKEVRRVTYQPEHPTDCIKLISPSRKDFINGKFLLSKVTSERETDRSLLWGIIRPGFYCDSAVSDTILVIMGVETFQTQDYNTIFITTLST
jgi:hypothetical protein